MVIGIFRHLFLHLPLMSFSSPIFFFLSPSSSSLIFLLHLRLLAVLSYSYRCACSRVPNSSVSFPSSSSSYLFLLVFSSPSLALRLFISNLPVSECYIQQDDTEYIRQSRSLLLSRNKTFLAWKIQTHLFHWHSWNQYVRTVNTRPDQCVALRSSRFVNLIERRHCIG